MFSFDILSDKTVLVCEQKPDALPHRFAVESDQPLDGLPEDVAAFVLSVQLERQN